MNINGSSFIDKENIKLTKMNRNVFVYIYYTGCDEDVFEYIKEFQEIVKNEEKVSQVMVKNILENGCKLDNLFKIEENYPDSSWYKMCFNNNECVGIFVKDMPLIDADELYEICHEVGEKGIEMDDETLLVKLI